MQITELSAEGLRREYRIVVPYSDIARRVETKLTQISGQVRLPGFRPGKVPLKILQQRFGRSVMDDELKKTLSDATQQTINERGLRPALQPRVEVTQFEDGRDLECKMAVELLPEIGPVDFSSIALERLVAPVTDQEVDDLVDRVVAQQQKFTALPEPRPAQNGDQLLVDFTVAVDGADRPELAKQGHPVVLGANRILPGFDEQLVGKSAGDKVDAQASFPADHPDSTLAGKLAAFAVEIKEIRVPEALAKDDELAKSLGFEDFAKLRDGVRGQIESSRKQASRLKLKRQLLDILAERHHFAVPGGMVDLEFDAIWAQVKAAMERDPNDPEFAKPEDELKAEYRAIAERRVRLGLLLSEVGRANIIEVTQEELNRAVSAEVRRYPGREKEVMAFFRKNPRAVDNLRAPLYEDKVVDYIVELARVSEREVTPEELLRDPDLPSGLVGAGETATPTDVVAADEAGSEVPEETRT